MRLPAREIEPLVAEQIAGLLSDPLALCARLATSLQPGCIDAAIARGHTSAEAFRAGRDPGTMASAVERIDVAPDTITIALRPIAMLDLLGVAADPTAPM